MISTRFSNQCYTVILVMFPPLIDTEGKVLTKVTQGSRTVSGARTQACQCGPKVLSAQVYLPLHQEGST